MNSWKIFNGKIPLSWILKKAGFVIFALPAAENDLVMLGVSKNQIIKMINGINTGIIDQIKAKEYLFDGVFMGSIVLGKGIFDLPEIWRKVIDVFPRAKLAIMGAGPHKIINKLRDEIERKNIKESMRS